MPNSQRAGFSRIIHLTLLLMLLTAACGRDEEPADESIKSRAVMSDPLTCVVSSADSTSLLLGSEGPSFSIFDIRSETSSNYALPPFTRGWKTYDILQLSPTEYLIAKRNLGVIYARYGTGVPGINRPEHIARVKFPPKPLPDKGTHYSVYSIIPADSTILLGSSNGLAYIDAGGLQQLRADSVAFARFAAPLAHMRQSKLQFSQESMFLQGDSLLTVTDHGIYRLALSDIRNEETALTTINPDMRCWDAAFVGDSLAVLWSPAKNSGMRRVTMFSASGNEGSTIDADPATTWITEFGGKLRCFGREGDFGCFRSAANIGGELYFIRDGELRRSSETKPEDDSDEWILMADNGYGLSNLSGLWKLNGDEPEFLGELKGVTGVRDISCDDGTMYLAAGDGLYAVSLAGHIFPHKRKAKLIEGNSNENSDRVESILAMGDTLYVGTRHGLHALIPGSGETRKYGFPALWASFESPYITDITRGKDGSLLMQTLNFGVWRLPSADSENAVATSLSMPAAAPMNTEALHRPATTWGSIGRTIVLLVAGILLLLGVMVLILFFIQRRHRLAVSALNTSLSSERKQYQSQKEELLRSREELATRQHELETLRQQHEEALRDTRHKMSEPMKRVAECLKQTIAAMPPDCAVAARLEQYLKPIAAFADSSAEDAEMSDAATHSCRLLLRYVNESVAAAENLVENVPKQGVMQQPLEQYAAKIRSMGDVRAASLSVQLKWLSQAVGVLMEAENTILARISELCERDGDTSNQFYSEDLAELWNDIVVPAARKMSRCALAKDGLNKDTDLVTRRRTWIFTTITFYGCTAPEIDGRALTVDVRSLIRFENSARLGTIFNFWASQLSTTCMEYGPAGIPGSPADIMWKVWLSRQTVNLLGGNCSVTLPDGIRLAFARQHKLPIPPDLEARLGTRTIGRPKNS